MDIKALTGRAKELFGKYKYAVMVVLIGLGLLLIPERQTKKENVQTVPEVTSQSIADEALSDILQTIDGVGKVQVMLSVSAGEKTLYQTDTDTSTRDDGSTVRTETILVTDGQRTESGLITQVNPPVYLGAIVVCQGAESPGVRLSVTQAVSKITGLGSDKICVLKMK